MKALSIGAAVGLAVLVLGAGYVARAQTPKWDVLVEFEISKGGSVVGKPSVRMADGATASFRLSDGTEVKLTSKVISH